MLSICSPSDGQKATYEKNTLPAGSSVRFDNPHALLSLRLVEASIEICELVWKDESVWYDIERLFAELLLHSHHVCAHSVLARQLSRAREVIDLLILVQPFNQKRLWRRARPQHVPVVTFGVREACAASVYAQLPWASSMERTSRGSALKILYCSSPGSM